VYLQLIWVESEADLFLAFATGRPQEVWDAELVTISRKPAAISKLRIPGNVWPDSSCI
jgi:hypothetical protein